MHDYSPEQAQRIAIRELAQEEREQRKQAANNNHVGGGALYRKLSGILERMFGGNVVQEPERGSPINGELALPNANIVNRTNEPEVPKPRGSDVPCGVWTGTSDGSAAVLIDDAEFSPRWHDITTTAWKQSIAYNERVERERTALWEKRLNELRGRS